jgi:hypothetical protein
MSVDTVAQRRARLIRKAQDAVIFAAPESAAPVTALTTGASADLAPLPTDYEALGHHTEDDGINWTRDVNSEDVRSHGSQEPTRRDITSDVRGLVVLAQETKRLTMELFNSVDLSALTPDATTKEIKYSPARTPQTKYYRLLAVGQDGAGADTIYFARFCPRASVTDYDDQPWTKADEVRWPLTFTAYVDDTLGYAMTEFWGGPGIADLISDMGFATTP